MKVAANPERKMVFAGKDYYFCSVHCLDKFRNNPQQYLSPKEPEPAAAAPEGTIYTCPMHPQIRQPTPGNCPICGMALEPLMPELNEKESPELADFRRRFWWTLPLTIVVTLIAMTADHFSPGGIPYQNWIELLLSTPVVLWTGWPIFERCTQSIRNRSPNMWTLIGLGVAAAYGYSLAATMAPDLFPPAFRAHGRIGVYYEAAAVIVSLTILGQILELRARSQCDAGQGRLARHCPGTGNFRGDCAQHAPEPGFCLHL